MKHKKIVFPVIWMAVGVALFLGVVYCLDIFVFEGTITINPSRKYQCGDLTFSQIPVPKSNRSEKINPVSALGVYKGNQILATLTQDEAGNTISLIISNANRYEPSFTVDFRPDKGIERALYGKEGSDLYWDINHNGQFDIRLLRDRDGQISDFYIYLNNSWEKVDKANSNYATVGEKRFQFDENKGWIDYVSEEENEGEPGSQ